MLSFRNEILYPVPRRCIAFGGYAGIFPDAATILWVAAVVAAGGTVSATQQGYVDTLIRGLKADGIWSKLDVLWLYACENATQASIDLVGLRTHTLHSSPTFTASKGYAGDGSAAFIDTGWNPSTMGVNFTQNAAALFTYVQTPDSRSASIYTYFGKGNNPSTNISKNTGSTQLTYGINTTAGATAVTTTIGVTVPGFVYAERSGGSVTAFGANGGTLAAAALASSATANFNWYALAGNNTGTAGNFTNATMGCWGAAANLGQFLSTKLNQRLFAYLYSQSATNYPLDAAASTWVTNVTGAGGTVSTLQAAYVSVLIAGLKASTVWTSLDSLWLYAAENATQASIDLVGGLAHTLHSSPTFTATVGYAGDGVAAYIDTGLTTSAGVNFAQNSACEGVWIVSADASTGRNYFSAANNNALSSNGAVTLVWAVNATAVSFSFGSATGNWHLDRSGASAAALYQNGSSVATNAAASSAPFARNWFTFAANNSGVAANFGTGQLACFFTGATLGATGAAALYNSLRAHFNTQNPGIFT